MGGFCGGGGSKTPSSSSSSRNRSKSTTQAITQKMGRDYTGITSSSPGIKDTFLMDIGAKEKTSGYYSALSGRQEASRAAMESAMSNKSDDGPGLSSAAGRSAASAAGGSSAVSSAPTPPPVPGDGSAPGAEEAKVMEGAKTRKGRASTVKTDMQGLLADAKTRRRRSLLAGQGEGSSGLIS